MQTPTHPWFHVVVLGLCLGISACSSSSSSNDDDEPLQEVEDNEEPAQINANGSFGTLTADGDAIQISGTVHNFAENLGVGEVDGTDAFLLEVDEDVTITVTITPDEAAADIVIQISDTTGTTLIPRGMDGPGFEDSNGPGLAETFSIDRNADEDLFVAISYPPVLPQASTGYLIEVTTTAQVAPLNGPDLDSTPVRGWILDGDQVVPYQGAVLSER